MNLQRWFIDMLVGILLLLAFTYWVMASMPQGLTWQFDGKTHTLHLGVPK